MIGGQSAATGRIEGARRVSSDVADAVSLRMWERCPGEIRGEMPLERSSKSEEKGEVLILVIDSDRKKMDVFRSRRGNRSTTSLRTYLVSHLASAVRALQENSRSQAALRVCD